MTVQKVLINSFSSAFISLVVVVFVQASLFQNSSFMGIAATEASANIALSYPWVTAIELGKIFFLSFLFLFLGFLNFYCLDFGAKQKNNLHKCLCLAAEIFLYALFLLAAILEFPAVYESFLSPSVSSFIFGLSFWMNPHVLSNFSMFCFLGLSLYSFLKLLKQKLQNQSIILVMAFLVIGFVVCYYKQRPMFLYGSLVEKSTRPLVLLIGVDSLRTDQVTSQTMPNLSAMASQDDTVLFSDHIVGIPRTFPSWIEIIRGEYSALSGVRHMFPNFLVRKDLMTGLVSELQKNNYQTSVVSDFAGDIFPRFRAGYDKIETPNLSVDNILRMNLDQSFVFFLPLVHHPLFMGLFEPHLLENPPFADPLKLSKKAINLIHTHNFATQPLFLTLFYSTAHFPYAAQWPWYRQFSQANYSGPYYFQKNQDLKNQNKDLTEADVKQIMSLYQGAVHGIDCGLSDLFEYLKKNGLWDQTLLIVTADHGEDLLEIDRIQGHGDHLRGENVNRVPFMIKLPKSLASSLKVKNIPFTTRVIDLAPTVLGLLELSNTSMQGKDLSPWFFDKEKKAPTLYAYTETEIWFSRYGNAFFQSERLDYPGISELLDFDAYQSKEIILNPKYEKIIVAAKHRSITQGQYKLIYTPTRKGALFKLYDRHKDPYNVVDISVKEPAVFKMMQEKFFEYIKILEPKTAIHNSFMVPL